MISANGVTIGRGSLVLADAADLIESMQIAAALSFEAFEANFSVIHPGGGAGAAAHRSGDRDGAAARAAGGQRAVASRRRAQPPGPAVDPLCPPDPWRGLRRSLGGTRDDGDRAQLRRRQPARAGGGGRDRVRGELRRDLAGDGLRLRPAGDRARRPGGQRAGPEAALAPLQRAADGAGAPRRAEPAACVRWGARSRRWPPRPGCWPIRCRSITEASSPRASRTTPRWRRWRSAPPRHWSACCTVSSRSS